MPRTLAIYTRVSTADQDSQRQVDELREYAGETYPDHKVREYADIASGTTTAREEYDRLQSDIGAGQIDRVIVDEISRLSRLGGGEIHEFLQHALDHDTSVEDREVGLEIDVSDDMVDQAVSELIAGLMGQLAKIEHKQKLRRIRSGIRAAQEAGKWTGRPPRGFEVGDDGFLHVDTAEYLRTRAALERVQAGESASAVADATGVPSSTISRLYDERRDLYLGADPADERVDAALEEIRPLEDLTPDTDEFESRVRDIVRDEISCGE